MKKFFTALMALVLTAATAVAQNAGYSLKPYPSTNGGILTNIAPDGKWAVINLGTSASGLSCPSELYNTATGEHFSVTYRNQVLNFINVSNEDAQGYVTIVGSLSNRPMAYRFRPAEPKTEGKFTIFANKTNWSTGVLTAVTPDGKYAIGHFTNYTGQDVAGAELNGEFWFDGIYADLSEGKIIDNLEGLPTGDRFGNNQHAINFDAISPDGKKILGTREWFMPSEGFYFIYDVDTHKWDPIGFAKTTGNRLQSVNGIQYIDFPVMSPNGKYVGGLAIVYSEDEQDYTEIKAPFRYNVETKELTIFSDAESANISVGCMDDEGTIFGYPETGSPLRNFKIFYQDKFWIPFSQLCQQVYGLNFFEKTGFEFSGTATSVSADGSKFVAFSDPTDQSYFMDFGKPVEEVCSHFDLLSNYSVSPEAGSVVSRISKVEVNFGRAVQVLGKGSTHLHLYKVGKNGNGDTKVCDGLSTEYGIEMKNGSATVVNFSIQSRYGKLEEGEEYYFLIDAGAVAVASDASKVNKAIHIPYKGRKEGPVSLVKAVPESGSELKHLDGTSYIQLTFDCPIMLNEGYKAYIERVEDQSHVAPLTIAVGSTKETKNQILLYPVSPVYLYQDVQYKVVIEAGALSDYSGIESSYNNAIELMYNGTYVREIQNESTLFADTFNDPNGSLNLWLNYEGDHNKPLVEQQEWGFDADNTPWNFSTHDAADDPDYYATSHSLYAPSGTSEDWMMTPQLQIPEDSKVFLTFDAQKWKSNKDDHLWLYIYEDSRVISYLNDNNMKVIQENVVLLDEITDLNGGNGTVTKGNWKSYRYDLSAYAGKDIYIAFVNKNTNQSCVFVDNVLVAREILYTIGFNNEERVVGQDEILIKGNFTIKTKEFAKGAISLTLKDAEGEEVSTISWPSVSGTSIVDRPLPMNFANPLSLVKGEENPFTIDVEFNGETATGEPFVKKDTYQGSIANLLFLPTKRVVLEEMTGITCPNCPQGHISIGHCEAKYQDQFIPISIHSYDGDDLGAQFYPYSAFLGLNGAPSARINRIDGIFYPMYGTGSDVLYDMPEQNLWFNVIGKELARPTLCDVAITARMNAAGDAFDYKTSVKFAINEKRQTSLFFVIMEDGIISFQENNFANSEIKNLGEWGLGGIYGSYYAYPVTHNDVVRGIVGETFSGTLGMLPSSFTAGELYSTDEYEYRLGDNIENKQNLKIAALLIDTETGEVINAALAHVQPAGDNVAVDALQDETAASQDAPLYNLAGQRVKKGHKGIVIQNNRKFIRQ